MKTYKSRVLSTKFHLPNFYQLDIEKPEEFSYSPGQVIAVHAYGDRRFYSLASHPDENRLTLGIKIKPNGKFSSRLFKEKELKISGPYGLLHKRAFGHKKVALVGFGSAITPFISLLKEYRKEKPEVLMLYGEREAVPFHDFLSGLGPWFRLETAFSSQGKHVQDLFPLVDEFVPDIVIGIGSASFAEEVRERFSHLNVAAEGFG